MDIKKVFFGFVFYVVLSFVNGSIQFEVPTPAFDNSLFEEVLDEELCAQQIDFIRSTPMLALQFADAGIRVPRGILEGNTLDMGNYHQCININQQIPESELQGKYCVIRVPSNQNVTLPPFPFDTEFDPRLLTLSNETIGHLEEYGHMRRTMETYVGLIDDQQRIAADIPLPELVFSLAVCIPRPCTTRQAFDSFLFNLTETGFQYSDSYCRLPGDKPRAPADYVAIGVFSALGLLTLASTIYDFWHAFVNKTDSKEVSVLCKSFSVYTNGRRLMTFNSSPDTIECLDGIRAIAMAWIVLGHSFVAEMSFSNPLDAMTWRTSWQSLWVIVARYAVDTFFTLSGFLVVYTTVGKINGVRLLKNLHLFYLNRLLRLFPLLAAVVLLEASYLNRMSDGPNWNPVAWQVNNCRATWWSTLLHIQNYMSPNNMCISQAWYLAIDVQLHILSPIILVWVLWGRKRIAWTALLGGLISVLIASTIFVFIYEFPPAMGGVPGSEKGKENYLQLYYVNTLTRAAPFLVGMIFGYLVRVLKIKLNGIVALFFWILVLALGGFLMYFEYPTSQLTWDNQLMTNIYNSFFRGLWGVFIGCIIYACANGFAGPINWFLSLQFWKLHSRLSYPIYLFHQGLMMAVNFSAVSPVFFSAASITFKFLAHYSFAMAVSFLMALVVDGPFSTLFKLLLGGGFKNPVKKNDDDNVQGMVKGDNKTV